jgi:glucose/arabinose dehydrogenase
VDGYTASIYAEGLSSPDGLAFSPSGVLHVAEEAAGRVSQIGPSGLVTPLMTGLQYPEGIAFDDAGNLYVVEDVQAGRLIRRTPGGAVATLADGLEAPEGVVWTSDNSLYVTESNIEFENAPGDLRTRVACVAPSGEVTRILTSTPIIAGTNVRFWSYAGLATGPDGQLYVTNEISGREITRTVVVIPGVLSVTFALSTTDSVFAVEPASGERTLFASGLVAPEGPRFADGGGFPLYVAEEDLGGGAGRLSRVAPDGSHTPLCTGFANVEDVAVDEQGALYVSEDTTGLIIRIQPPAVYSLTVAPASGQRVGDPGSTLNHTLRVTNTGNAYDAFDVSIGSSRWTTAVDPAVVGPLEAGTDADVVVGVSIPADAAGGATDVVTVTVTSQGDPTATADAVLTTAAANVYGLAVSPAAGARTGLRGAIVTYTLQVLNLGNTWDTLDLRVTGHHWDTAVVPAVVGPLAMGANAQAVISVTVPSDAPDEAVDVASIIVASRGDEGVSDTAVLTTTATGYVLFLPVVVR